MRSFLFHLCQLCWLSGIQIYSIHFLMLHELLLLMVDIIVYQVVFIHHSNPILDIILLVKMKKLGFIKI